MRRQGFTLIEILLTLGLVSILGAGIYLFSSTSSRFIARNLATNHSHEGTRISSLTFLHELRDSASAFRLFTAKNNTFTEVTAKSSSEVDTLSGQYISNRTNGVRFRRLLGGPFTLAKETEPSTTKLQFNFGELTGADLPTTGDKLVLPLISREYDITVVSSDGEVTISQPLGYTLDVKPPNIITGYFYRRAAFTVENQELRYHPNFTGASQGKYQVVRTGITTPTPFSLLFPSASALNTTATELRVSMEVTDLGYSARNFGTGTTTLHSIYTPRNQPTPISSAN